MSDTCCQLILPTRKQEAATPYKHNNENVPEQRWWLRLEWQNNDDCLIITHQASTRPTQRWECSRTKMIDRWLMMFNPPGDKKRQPRPTQRWGCSRTKTGRATSCWTVHCLQLIRIRSLDRFEACPHQVPSVSLRFVLPYLFRQKCRNGWMPM